MSLGYDLSLPSLAPFMGVEKHEEIKDGDTVWGLIAFGAYNSMGLIGPEKGGVALVIDAPVKSVVATLDIPYKPKERQQEVDALKAIATAGENPGRRLQDYVVAHDYQLRY